MISQSNGKAVLNLNVRHSEISFQVYGNTNSHIHDKNEVRRLTNVLRGKAKNGFSFPTIKGVDKLIAVLNSGKSIHYGITYKSCESADVEYFSGCFVDYDGKSKAGEILPGSADIEQLIALPSVQKYVAFYQPSSKGLPNSHWHVNYDRDCSYDEHVIVIKVLVQILNEELEAPVKFDSCVEGNSNNVCYASKSPCLVLDNNFGELIPVEEFLKLGDEYGFTLQPKEVRKERKKKAEKVDEKIFGTNEKISQPESKKGDDTGVTEKVLKHIKTEFLNKNPEAEFEDFYNLYAHNFKNYGDKAKGMNPFSPTNDSGESFVIFDHDDDLPPRWHDGTKSTKETTLIEYFYRLGRLSGKYQQGGLKGAFKSIVRDICNHYDIPQYQWVTNAVADVSSLMLQVCEDLKGVLYSAQWGDITAGNTQQFYYKNGNEFFKQYSLQAISLKLKEYVLETYPEFENSMLARAAADKNFKYKGINKEIVNWFSDNQSPLKILYTFPNWNQRYIPFMNGLYDTHEKALIANDGQAFNTSVVGRDFDSVGDDHPGVVALKKWISGWMPEQHKHDYILNYIKICAQGRANEIITFPCIYGRRGTGKSTLGSVVTSIFPEDLGVCLVNSKQPLNPSNNHGEAELEGKFLWTLKEISQNSSSSMDKILDFFGEDNAKETININPKGKEQRSIKKMFGLIADSEKIPQLPKSKKGYYRRFVFIESRYAPEVVEYIDIVKQYSHEVYCWLIAQDFGQAKSTLNEALKNPYFDEKSKEVQKENSDLDQFIDTIFVVTNDDLSHNGQDIFGLYIEWCKRENMRALDSRVFGKYFKSGLEDFDWIENTTRSNGKTIYKGLKLRDEFKGYKFTQMAALAVNGASEGF